MSTSNPTVDYVAELLALTKVYRAVSPQVRYNTIRQRLAVPEIGATKLISVVSAVEGLARSIAVHNKAPRPAAAVTLYASYCSRAPTTIVEEVFKFYRVASPSTYFTDDTWSLFRHAVNYRNLVVHECTYLGQDKYPLLIDASLEVLDSLATLAGLRAKRT
jgi:hypothetical protein